MGCADLTYWPELSEILGVDVIQMMEGEITENGPDSGKMERIKFYVCPACGNILTSTGSASIYCCGRKLEVLDWKENEETPAVTVQESDSDYFVTVEHPMEKDHFLSFAACVKNDQMILKRLYPEQSPQFRIPRIKRGTLYLYCVKHGLSFHKLP